MFKIPSGQIIITNARLMEILTAMTQAAPGGPEAGLWNGAKIHLFTAPDAPTLANVVGDYVVPTFTGYAASATITWQAVQVDANGNVKIRSDMKQFTRTGGAVSEIVKGYTVQTAANALLWAVLLDEPVNFNEVGRALNIVAEFELIRA